MDLAKIIAEMRLELQCLETAIASIEELARVQNVLTDELLGAPIQTDEEGAPVKRPRGRPRKNPPMDSAPAQPNDPSTSST
jgi:hypothetical protein